MDDEEEYWPEIAGAGSATVSDRDEDEMPVACIYVPNTDTRSGWGMRMVYRPRDESRRPIGFGRR